MSISDLTIDFGTSGLRGSADGFTPQTVSAFVGGFLETTAGSGEQKVVIGADLRDSSPRIAGLVVGAVRSAGWEPVYAGNVPTPALAAYAMGKGWPAIMVTGSHIPETYNGLKFYRRDGEFLKVDEAPVREAADRLLAADTNSASTELPEVDPAAATSYLARYVNAFGSVALEGLKIGVDQHSAVGRDLLIAILEGLGATCFAFRRMDSFVAVDTEALDADDIARAHAEIARHSLDAVVSTDGDGDRPLVIDETGAQINGDVLGALTARALGSDVVVTPLSSTTAIELSDWFSKTVRTRIGSPYVVSAMREAEAPGIAIAGFEANGGFLLQSAVSLRKGQLSALPTRDAVLPIVAVLAHARESTQTLSALAASLPSRVTKAGRLKQVPASVGAAFLQQVQTSPDLRGVVHALLTSPAHVDAFDGVRMTLEGNVIVHFRQSGNAPEMRCYVETQARDHTVEILGDVMKGLKRVLEQEVAV